MAPLWGSGDTAANEPKIVGILTQYDTTNLDVYGVDASEVGIARTTPYAVAHQGWVGIRTHTDMHGNLRVKSEVLVAIGITGLDQADDDDKFLP